MSDKKVTIVGAGPAGLTAAVILKREGYEPIVYEAEKTYGGDPSWHPSVHGTPVNLDLLEDYTGIDFSPVFHEVDVKKNYKYYYNLDEVQRPGFDFDKDFIFNVERGPRECSLDGFLYKMACDMGIPVVFDSRWTKEDFENAGPNTIIATGLDGRSYQERDVKSTPFFGYWTSQECDPDLVSAATYEGDFTNEYAYACTANGLWYCLLFAKGDVSRENLEKFGELMYKIDGRKVLPEDWARFTGSTVRNPMFRNGNLTFTGTAAGMIEPARGYGIVGALLSGRIAAWSITDPEKAQREYDRFMDPLKKHVAMKIRELKAGEKYVSASFMDHDDLWFDMPTIKSGVRDRDIQDKQE